MRATEISRLALVGSVALTLPTQACAAHAIDFAGLAVCSTLSGLPPAHRPIGCDATTPLRGECRFTLTLDGLSVAYLIEEGVVLSKTALLRRGVSMPYGLRAGDTNQVAARKILARTGLTSRSWKDTEEPTVTYLQSRDVNCGAQRSYAIYVWFSNGRARTVSVSTLPPF